MILLITFTALSFPIINFGSKFSFTEIIAQTPRFCGLRKLNLLNLRLFVCLQNLRHHFSTV